MEIHGDPVKPLVEGNLGFKISRTFLGEEGSDVAVPMVLTAATLASGATPTPLYLTPMTPDLGASVTSGLFAPAGPSMATQLLSESRGTSAQLLPNSEGWPWVQDTTFPSLAAFMHERTTSQASVVETRLIPFRLYESVEEFDAAQHGHRGRRSSSSSRRSRSRGHRRKRKQKRKNRAASARKQSQAGAPQMQWNQMMQHQAMQPKKPEEKPVKPPARAITIPDVVTPHVETMAQAIAKEMTKAISDTKLDTALKKATAAPLTDDPVTVTVTPAQTESPKTSVESAEIPLEPKSDPTMALTFGPPTTKQHSGGLFTTKALTTTADGVPENDRQALEKLASLETSTQDETDTMARVCASLVLENRWNPLVGLKREIDLRSKDQGCSFVTDTVTVVMDQLKEKHKQTLYHDLKSAWPSVLFDKNTAVSRYITAQSLSEAFADIGTMKEETWTQYILKRSVEALKSHPLQYDTIAKPLMKKSAKMNISGDDAKALKISTSAMLKSWKSKFDNCTVPTFLQTANVVGVSPISAWLRIDLLLRSLYGRSALEDCRKHPDPDVRKCANFIALHSSTASGLVSACAETTAYKIDVKGVPESTRALRETVKTSKKKTVEAMMERKGDTSTFAHKSQKTSVMSHLGRPTQLDNLTAHLPEDLCMAAFPDGQFGYPDFADLPKALKVACFLEDKENKAKRETATLICLGSALNALDTGERKVNVWNAYATAACNGPEAVPVDEADLNNPERFCSCVFKRVGVDSLKLHVWNASQQQFGDLARLFTSADCAFRKNFYETGFTHDSLVAGLAFRGVLNRKEVLQFDIFRTSEALAIADEDDCFLLHDATKTPRYTTNLCSTMALATNFLSTSLLKVFEGSKEFPNLKAIFNTYKAANSHLELWQSFERKKDAAILDALVNVEIQPSTDVKTIARDFGVDLPRPPPRPLVKWLAIQAIERAPNRGCPASPTVGAVTNWKQASQHIARIFREADTAGNLSEVRMDLISSLLFHLTKNQKFEARNTLPELFALPVSELERAVKRLSLCDDNQAGSAARYIVAMLSDPDDRPWPIFPWSPHPGPFGSWLSLWHTTHCGTTFSHSRPVVFPHELEFEENFGEFKAWAEKRNIKFAESHTLPKFADSDVAEKAPPG